MNENVKKYVAMQLHYYNSYIEQLGYDACKNLVGAMWFDPIRINHSRNLLLHNRNYDRALDFGCGIGRLIAGLHNHFNFVDGMDLSLGMLKYAKQYLDEQGVPESKYALHECNGWNLEGLDSEIYDIVYSEITLHHICVWKIRHNYFKEFYRVLKPGGIIAIQMFSGLNFQNVVASPWYSNTYNAMGTNSSHDVKLENPYYLVEDWVGIGFKNINISFYKENHPENTGAAEHEYSLIIRGEK